MKSSLTKLNLALLLASIAPVPAAELPLPIPVVHDLTPLHDPARVLVNPHKGWYHHFPDNHPDKYRIAGDADLLEFPGMDHLYIRLAWAYLEPKEGQFDWGVIDPIIEKWTVHGLGIAFRISCKETSTDRIEQQFATPRWVMEAGAKGGHYRMGKATGPEGPWEPEFDDPIFLAKLDRFLAAFAARYDAKPWVRYVDVGSIGDWGEGHSWAGSRKHLSFGVRKQHVDLHLKHFKRSHLVISDDYVHALSDPAERASLHQYILANGISYRDDSILVDGYLQGTSDTFTVRSPEFFADAYLRNPTVFELEHYGQVKRLGNWEVRPDSSAARFGKGKTGPDFFRGALGLLHATYIGYHGDAREWLNDNPELTKELLNKCGYWLFPKSLELPEPFAAGATMPFTLTLENRGVAPPYAPYELRVKLSSGSTNWVHVAARAEKSWLPGQPIVLPLALPLPAAVEPGLYQLAIGLFDATAPKERPVEFALKESARDYQGYYRLGTVTVSDETSGAEAGWTRLFNGNNLDGWVVKCRPEDRDKMGYWKVVDGTITAETPPGSKHDYIWLLTEKEYGDFTLRLKVQTHTQSTGNSGIQVRSRYDDDAGWLDGPQVDINPPGTWRNGFIYDETRGVQVWLWPNVGRPANAKPEHAPQGSRWWHAGDRDVWNEVQITCRGTRITTVINGVTIADYDGAGRLDDETHRTRNVGMKGHIGLQIHPGGELNVRFKDLELQQP
jgi:hypothetical protein